MPVLFPNLVLLYLEEAPGAYYSCYVCLLLHRNDKPTGGCIESSTPAPVRVPRIAFDHRSPALLSPIPADVEVLQHPQDLLGARYKNPLAPSNHDYLRSSEQKKNGHMRRLVLQRTPPVRV